jgi:hypothetical protein
MIAEKREEEQEKFRVWAKRSRFGSKKRIKMGTRSSGVGNQTVEGIPGSDRRQARMPNEWTPCMDGHPEPVETKTKAEIAPSRGKRFVYYW